MSRTLFAFLLIAFAGVISAQTCTVKTENYEAVVLAPGDSCTDEFTDGWSVSWDPADTNVEYDITPYERDGADDCTVALTAIDETTYPGNGVNGYRFGTETAEMTFEYRDICKYTLTLTVVDNSQTTNTVFAFRNTIENIVVTQFVVY